VEGLTELGTRIVTILGEGASRDLLSAITRPEDERAALIGRLYVREDTTWLAEMLTDIETDERLRFQVSEALRLVLSDSLGRSIRFR
jgi:hypothetical protein